MFFDQLRLVSFILTHIRLFCIQDFYPLRDRLTAGRRVLAPLIQVRILVPQPNKIKGL